MFVYVLSGSEGIAMLLGVIVSIWQGILLWRGKPDETNVPAISTSGPD
jgi:hypothetical protein